MKFAEALKREFTMASSSPRTQASSSHLWSPWRKAELLHVLGFILTSGFFHEVGYRAKKWLFTCKWENSLKLLGFFSALHSVGLASVSEDNTYIKYYNSAEFWEALYHLQWGPLKTLLFSITKADPRSWTYVQVYLFCKFQWLWIIGIFHQLYFFSDSCEYG